MCDFLDSEFFATLAKQTLPIPHGLRANFWVTSLPRYLVPEGPERGAPRIPGHFSVERPASTGDVASAEGRLSRWAPWLWRRHSLGRGWKQENGGFHKWGYPQIIHFNGIFHDKPSISGYPIYGPPPPNLVSSAENKSMQVWTYDMTNIAIGIVLKELAPPDRQLMNRVVASGFEVPKSYETPRGMSLV